MSEALNELEPRLLWKHFLQLSKIPRGSGNESASCRYVEKTARSLGLEVVGDAAGNMIIRKSATGSGTDRDGVVLQAHVDMVCEKNEGTCHDFLTDPIDVILCGDVVTARGTTLGADNGIGVAAALAILEAEDISHGPLEVLITVDEETGLTGANEFSSGVLRGKYLINLDSEEEGVITIGCAGGVDTSLTRSVKMKNADPSMNAWRIKAHGLKGGHSGVDIHRGRGNSISILARALARLILIGGVGLVSIDGGNKRNAIPREAFAVITGPPGIEDAIRNTLSTLQGELVNELGSADPDLLITADQLPTPGEVMSTDDAFAVIAFLNAAPHGVLAMSPDFDGLVQTSVNLGVIETIDGKVVTTFLTRSSVDSAKMAVAGRLSALASLAGMECAHDGGYPGWKPLPDTHLVRLMSGVYERMYHKPIALKALHAGLECGIIGQKYPGMEMASIGPDIREAHTPDEKVTVSSVLGFWNYLKTVIETL